MRPVEEFVVPSSVLEIGGSILEPARLLFNNCAPVSNGARGLRVKDHPLIEFAKAAVLARSADTFVVEDVAVGAAAAESQPKRFVLFDAAATAISVVSAASARSRAARAARVRTAGVLNDAEIEGSAMMM